MIWVNKLKDTKSIKLNVSNLKIQQYFISLFLTFLINT